MPKSPAAQPCPQRPEAGAFCNVAAAYNQIWHLAGGLGEFFAET